MTCMWRFTSLEHPHADLCFGFPPPQVVVMSPPPSPCPSLSPAVLPAVLHPRLCEYAMLYDFPPSFTLGTVAACCVDCHLRAASVGAASHLMMTPL